MKAECCECYEVFDDKDIVLDFAYEVNSMKPYCSNCYKKHRDKQKRDRIFFHGADSKEDREWFKKYEESKNLSKG